MESTEFRLKRFLHYGCEERVYIPNRSVRFTFDPDKAKSIIELLSKEETDKTIASTVLKVKKKTKQYLLSYSRLRENLMTIVSE